ncbi:hypothetical protein F5884DRAFT_742862 [Xylogone sp. PMI_703]|nr:hypothetical protein F5884DRAFT_742862 [Xylogone sp. PMI_703]
MKAALFSCAYLFSTAFGVAITACNANNCARAVTGTNIKTPVASSRQADCSSFMLTTVTPDTFTTTVATVTIYTDAPSKRDVEARMLAGRDVTVIPTNVPAYASPCSGTARYSSACICWGITAAVTTAPRPTATVTATVYLQRSCSNPGECGTYNLYDCPGEDAPSDICVCAVDTDGSPRCVQNAACTAACATDADCGDGNICWDKNCCGYPICTRPSTVCPNAASKRSLFGISDAVKARRGEDCSGVYCPNGSDN